jgi:hypothetical protein
MISPPRGLPKSLLSKLRNLGFGKSSNMLDAWFSSCTIWARLWQAQHGRVLIQRQRCQISVVRIIAHKQYSPYLSKKGGCGQPKIKISLSEVKQKASSELCSAGLHRFLRLTSACKRRPKASALLGLSAAPDAWRSAPMHCIVIWTDKEGL